MILTAYRLIGGFFIGKNMATVSKLQIVLEATTTAFDRGLKSAQQSLDGFAKKNARPTQPHGQVWAQA